jgi:hypothetical protein
LVLPTGSTSEAEKRILEGLARREGKDVRPKDRPDFPDRVKGQARPRFPGELPRIWNITEARNPYFTGRDEILRRLHEELGAGKQAALTQAIAGLGGVGKTQLAMEYAYRHASEYEGVWWLHAESPATLAAEYAALGPHLGVEMMTDQGAMIREVRARLAQQQGILLIFDNATQPSTLKPYLPLGPSQRVIVTTRAQYWPGAKAQEVPVLKLEQAVKFLFERTGRVRQVSIQSDQLQLRAGDAGARPPTRDSVAHTHCPQDSRGSHWQSPRAPSGRA